MTMIMLIIIINYNYRPNDVSENYLIIPVNQDLPSNHVPPSLQAIPV